MLTKRLPIVALCLLSVYSLSAQTLLRGLIAEQHSGLPLAGIAVSALGASQDRTDDRGLFQLSFTTKHPGEAIRLMISDPDGQRLVVNQTETERFTLPASQEAPMRIVMADKQAFRAAQLEYYGIVLPYMQQAAQQEQDSLFARLKRTQDEELTSVLTDKIAALRTDSASLAERAEELARYLARLDLSQASELQQEAISLIQAREVDAALAVLDGAKLESLYTTAKTQLDQAQQAILDVITGYELKAELLAGRFQYLEAATCWERIIEIRLSQLPDKRAALAAAYASLSDCFAEGGTFKRALASDQKALAIEEAVLAANHPDLAITYWSIGLVHLNLAQYDSAVWFFRKTLAIEERIHEADHPDLAITYNDLGMVYLNLAQYDSALWFSQRALAIQEAALDPTHPDLANTYNNLGNVYNHLVEYDSALGFHRKALTLLEAVEEANHRELATTYNYIGLVYRNLAQYDSALGYLQKALAVQEDILAVNHPYLAVTYHNIGLVYRNLAQYDSALAFHQRSLAIQEAVLAANHPNLATAYNNIALVYVNLAQFDSALGFHQQSLAIREAVFSPDHPSLAITYHNMGVLYQKLGQYDHALTLLQKAHTIWEEVYGLDHLYLGYGYAHVAICYLGKQDYPQAHAFLQRADPIFQQPAYAKHRLRITLEQSWTQYFAAQHQPEAALAKLEAAIALGFKDVTWLEKEADLAILREMPAFQQLLARLKEENR